MGRIEKTVFISYRRTNLPWALAVSQNLSRYGYDVFLDFNGIASGDFESVILGNIRARAHFLVLLTPSALERCGEAGDWLRREIETALELKRNIVPVILEGFEFHTPSIAGQLTGTLAMLRNYNGLRVPAEYFDEAMERLHSKFLNVPLDAVLHPASQSSIRVVQVEQAATRAAPPVPKNELIAQEHFENGFNAIDPEQRVRLFTEAIRLKPDFPEAFLFRAIERGEMGELDGALQDIEEAIQLRPTYADAFYLRGGARFDVGDIEGAIQDYNEAIRLKPDNAGPFEDRGAARARKGDFEGAIQDYNQSIRIDPSNASAFLKRSYVRSAQGDLEGTIRDCSEALRLRPDIADAFEGRAHARAAQGDLEGAIQDFNDSIRLNPNSAEAFNGRGLALAKKGDREGALHDYSEAIGLEPEFARAFYNRGNARKGNGDLDGAIQDYSEAIHRQPDFSAAFLGRGDLLANRALGSPLDDFASFPLDDLERGIEDLKEAARLDPDRPASLQDFQKSLEELARLIREGRGNYESPAVSG